MFASREAIGVNIFLLVEKQAKSRLRRLIGLVIVVWFVDDWGSGNVFPEFPLGDGRGKKLFLEVIKMSA